MRQNQNCSQNATRDCGNSGTVRKRSDLRVFDVGDMFTWWVPLLEKSLVSHWEELGMPERSLYSSVEVRFITPSDFNTILSIEKRIVTIANEQGIFKLGCMDCPINTVGEPGHWPASGRYTGVGNSRYHVEARKI